MIPIKHDLCNHEFGAPPGWNEEHPNLQCETLHVLLGVDEVTHTRAMQSFWKPTEEEIMALAKGAAVCLTIFGTTHPVVAVGVKE